jgi:HD-GYP domain-containing protein (c-di-GMP phosphodiesterase class II)
MLKKISVDQITVGMHLKEFCGSWMEHPFWRSGFVITDPKDIATILASSIKEVWIDCAKGVDVPAGQPAVSQVESEAQVEAELEQVTKERRDVVPVSVAAEFERAAKICAQSKRAVISMFEEARMGKAVDAGGALQLVEEITDSVSRNPSALISLARLKTADDYTYMHSVAVCAMMVALSKQLGLDEKQTRMAGVAGLMHDLGKAAMPMEVLNKPGKLTDAEFAIIKRHPHINAG